MEILEINYTSSYKVSLSYITIKDEKIFMKGLEAKILHYPIMFDDCVSFRLSCLRKIIIKEYTLDGARSRPSLCFDQNKNN